MTAEKKAQVRAAIWQPGYAGDEAKSELLGLLDAAEAEIGRLKSPAIAIEGQVCEGTISDLERRALILIRDEQEKLSPDNWLISVLCNTVRLCREAVDIWRKRAEAREETARECMEIVSASTLTPAISALIARRIRERFGLSE